MKKTFGYRHRWCDNIKTDLKELVCRIDSASSGHGPVVNDAPCSVKDGNFF